MNERPHIRVEMLSNPLYLSGARELVAAVADRLGFPEDACGHIKLAVDEALCNVIRHGYDRRPDGPIWLRRRPRTDAPTAGRPGGGGSGIWDGVGRFNEAWSSIMRVARSGGACSLIERFAARDVDMTGEGMACSPPTGKCTNRRVLHIPI